MYIRYTFKSPHVYTVCVLTMALQCLTTSTQDNLKLKVLCTHAMIHLHTHTVHTYIHIQCIVHTCMDTGFSHTYSMDIVMHTYTVVYNPGAECTCTCIVWCPCLLKEHIENVLNKYIHCIHVYIIHVHVHVHVYTDGMIIIL